MMDLQNMKCEACSSDARPLSESEIQTLIPKLSEWSVVESSGVPRLQRTFRTEKYSKSVSFTNAVAQIAEAEGHHPLIILEYSSVTVEWWSHKIQGLHNNDFIMASRTDEIFEQSYC